MYAALVTTYQSTWEDGGGENEVAKLLQLVASNVQ